MISQEFVTVGKARERNGFIEGLLIARPAWIVQRFAAVCRRRGECQ